METDHLPRDAQAHLARPSLWVAEPVDDLSPSLRMLFEGMNLLFGITDTPKTFARSLRKMPDFASFWFSYRPSSAKTSFTQDNAVAVSRQNRSQCWRAHALCPRRRTYLH